MDSNEVTFISGDGTTELTATWHPPTSRATNGAVIVLHGVLSDKDHEPGVSLCEGAAQLGLTALRFNFRSVAAGDWDGFDPSTQGVEDLLGAYNFLQSFGKEIKPKRLYLIGASLGGMVALNFAQYPAYAGAVKGVAVLGLVLYDISRQICLYEPGLPGMQSPLLVVQGERDPYTSPAELKEFTATLPFSNRVEIIQGAGHGYGPVSLKGAAQTSRNLQKVVEVTLNWLAEQDADREDLRK